jgi:hypothetical protein
MRKAVQLAQDAGLNVIMTLHDALYIMFDSTDLFAMATLKKCMYDAFIFYFNERDKEYAKLIRMDGKIWSQDFNLDNGVIDIALDFTVDSQKIFVDGRAKKQYAQFNRFFKHKLDHELL